MTFITHYEEFRSFQREKIMRLTDRCSVENKYCIPIFTSPDCIKCLDKHKKESAIKEKKND